MDCTFRVAKTKTLISFSVTAKLICVFVLAYAKLRFSDDVAHLDPLKAHLYVAKLGFAWVNIIFFFLF